MLGGPDFGAQLRYVGGCLQLLAGHTRSRYAAAANRSSTSAPTCGGPTYSLVASAYDFGRRPSACWTTPTTARRAVTLAENLPIRYVSGSFRTDRPRSTANTIGREHFFGHILRADILARVRTVTSVVGALRRVSARITEETPQGTYSIAGVGCAAVHAGRRRNLAAAPQI